MRTILALALFGLPVFAAAPPQSISAKAFTALVDLLEEDDFSTRKKAEARIEALGLAAVTQMWQVLDTTPHLHTRYVMGTILKRVHEGKTVAWSVPHACAARFYRNLGRSAEARRLVEKSQEILRRVPQENFVKMVAEHKAVAKAAKALSDLRAARERLLKTGEEGKKLLAILDETEMAETTLKKAMGALSLRYQHGFEAGGYLVGDGGLTAFRDPPHVYLRIKEKEGRTIGVFRVDPSGFIFDTDGDHTRAFLSAMLPAKVIFQNGDVSDAIDPVGRVKLGVRGTLGNSNYRAHFSVMPVEKPMKSPGFDTLVEATYTESPEVVADTLLGWAYPDERFPALKRTPVPVPRE